MSVEQELFKLRVRVSDLESALRKEQEVSKKIFDALDTGSVCDAFGHLFEPLDPILSSRVLNDGWRINKTCSRCGKTKGVWEKTLIRDVEALV